MIQEPSLQRHPAEIFGFPYSDIGEETRQMRAAQYCPFLRDECKKPRKSDPKTKVGICSVGYRGNLSETHIPVIICPHRFEVSTVKQVIEQHYFDRNDTILWLPEFHITKTVGFFDYVAVQISQTASNLAIQNFVCVEIQAAGTTGTPWNAFLEHQQTGKFSNSKYEFGINWANEFAKTMMQQAYKKGLIVSAWHKKLVFVVQDVGLRYLEQNYDTSSLRDANPIDPIDFVSLEMVWNSESTKWGLELVRRVSTDADGVRKMLAGITRETYPSLSQMTQQIEEKVIRLLSKDEV